MERTMQAQDSSSSQLTVHTKNNDQQAALCSTCAEIDWNLLLSTPSGGTFLGRVAQFTKGNCALCDFFNDILPDEAKVGDYSYASYWLRSVRSAPPVNDEGIGNASRSTLGETWSAVDVIVLRLDPAPGQMKGVTDGPGIPYILPRSPGQHTWFRPLKDRIDFDMIKQWLQACSSWHSPHCTRSEKPTSLNLIDCTSRTLVKGCGQSYVALSYVWGEENLASSENPVMTHQRKILPQLLPRTIEDAISVTRHLGFRYLWVDKYCIDQSNPAEMSEQIGQMDLVYQCADLTLIDASGKNSHEGLPGVSSCSRSPYQPTFQVGNIELVSTMQRPEWQIKISPWNHRAWTYQEGLLSLRRLVFTPQQVYFHCQGMYCKEAFNFPLSGLQRLHNEWNQQLCERYYNLEGIAAFPQISIGKSAWDIYTRLHEYSGRALSLDEDILNGILGLFRHCAAQINGQHLQHLWGLPSQYLYPNQSQHSKHGGMPSSERMPSFMDSLRWSLTRPSPRRKGFPSWSWTGWYGKVTWPKEFSPSNKDFFCHRFSWSMQVRLTHITGGQMDFKEAVKLASTTDPSSMIFEPYLLIKAHVFRLKRSDPRNDDSVFSPGFITEHSGLHLICTATTLDFLDISETYLGIYLSQSYPPGYESPYSEHLVVMKIGDRWERVAFGHYEGLSTSLGPGEERDLILC